MRERLAGAQPERFEIATSAPLLEVLAIRPRAVPTLPERGITYVPTAAGPVEVHSMPAGEELRDHLERRVFRVDAMANPADGDEVLDPFGGLRDLRDRTLRSVGPPEGAFANDPVLVVRCARLAASVRLRVEPRLGDAARAVLHAVDGAPKVRLRHEVCGLVQSDGAAEGLAWLRAVGLEEHWLGPTLPNADAVVAALPRELDLRLTAWLRGTPAESFLRKLRFPGRQAARILRLLDLHPLDQNFEPRSESSIRRLRRRAGPRDRRDLVTLRRAELSLEGARDDGSAGERLAAVERALADLERRSEARKRRDTLALDGAGVMQALACPAGPTVGRALRYLAEAVERDPAANTEERLRELLSSWEPDAPG